MSTLLDRTLDLHPDLEVGYDAPTLIYDMINEQHRWEVCEAVIAAQPEWVQKALEAGQMLKRQARRYEVADVLSREELAHWITVLRKAADEFAAAIAPIDPIRRA